MAAAHHPPWTGPIRDSRGDQVVVFATIFPALATLVVGLRLFARWTQSTGVGLDDVFIVISLVLSWILEGIQIRGWYYGLGRHAAEVPLVALLNYLKILYAFNLVYVISFACCKASILLFYLRVFATTRKRHITILVLLGFTVVWTFAFFIAFIFECTPVAFFWNKILHPKAGTCVNLEALYAAHAGTNVVTDMMIYIYPMFLVWKIKVSKAQKWGLLAIFLAGAVVVALSTVRAVTIPEVVKADVTWWQVRACVFISLEVNFGIIVASLPALRSLFACGLHSRRPTRGYNYDSGNTPRSATLASNTHHHRMTTTLAGIDAPSGGRGPNTPVIKMERLASESDIERGFESKETELGLPVMGRVREGR